MLEVGYRATFHIYPVTLKSCFSIPESKVETKTLKTSYILKMNSSQERIYKKTTFSRRHTEKVISISRFAS